MPECCVDPVGINGMTDRVGGGGGGGVERERGREGGREGRRLSSSYPALFSSLFQLRWKRGPSFLALSSSLRSVRSL